MPRAVRQQRWSHANVPLMWGASGNADSTPALGWSMETAGRMSEPIEFYGGRISARDALRTGWSSLREVFRKYGMAEPDHLTTWLRRQGFAGTAPGNHIAAMAQEFFLGEASRLDARVSLLEAVGESSGPWSDRAANSAFDSDSAAKSAFDSGGRSTSFQCGSRGS